MFYGKSRIKHLDIITSKCYLLYMRTTLDIDDDVLLAAKSLANKQSKSIGKVISELVRRAIAPAESPKIKNGVPLFDVKDSKEVVTFELVNSLRDE